MKKIMLWVLAVTTMLISLGGCFWGYPDHHRDGGYHHRGEGHEHGRDGDHDRDRDGDHDRDRDGGYDDRR